jgi:hypothetical protein
MAADSKAGRPASDARRYVIVAVQTGAVCKILQTGRRLQDLAKHLALGQRSKSRRSP